ncbi:hypothetical protein GV832_13965 [Rhodobacteraceae bacterium CYK-10]|uniref:Uncharacterized protein n=2 Tax=Stagnihabitans tardus TaxID=2699202 RepID=A0AAE4YEJ8_9RHOB|nr:hypothetical protein [Stagnihabitans tardus]
MDPNRAGQVKARAIARSCPPRAASGPAPDLAAIASPAGIISHDLEGNLLSMTERALSAMAHGRLGRIAKSLA